MQKEQIALFRVDFQSDNPAQVELPGLLDYQAILPLLRGRDPINLQDQVVPQDIGVTKLRTRITPDDGSFNIDSFPVGIIRQRDQLMLPDGENNTFAKLLRLSGFDKVTVDKPNEIFQTIGLKYGEGGSMVASISEILGDKGTYGLHISGDRITKQEYSGSWEEKSQNLKRIVDDRLTNIARVVTAFNHALRGTAPRDDLILLASE